MLRNRRCTAALAVVGLLAPLAAAAQGADRFQPSTPTALVERLDAARALRQGGHYEEAAAALRRILEEAPSYYRAQYNLALVYTFQEKNDEAVAAFERTLEIKAAEGIVDASIENSVGWFYLLRGDFAAAERHLQKAREELEVDEDAYESTKRKIYNNLGTLYLYMGDLDRAQDYLETAKSKFGSELAARNLEMLEDLRSKAQRKKN